MIQYLSEAYKPQEQLLFNYLLLRGVLDKLLKEQKFPIDIEAALLKVYKNFQTNADTLISLYNKIPGVLKLDTLLENIEDEIDTIFTNSDLNQPLLEESELMRALAKFIIEVNIDILEDSKPIRDAIPGFSWDIDSFVSVFSQIEEKGLNYAK